MRSRNARGFTLIEAMVSLVIFALITFALSMALSAAMRAQASSMRLQDQSGTERAVYGVIDRDIRAAFASANGSASEESRQSSANGTNGSSSSGAGTNNANNTPSPFAGLVGGNGLSSRFIAGAHGEQGGDALELTTLSRRFDLDPAASNAAAPQSDVQLVRYSFDPEHGELYRVVTLVPNAATLAAEPTRSEMLARNVTAFSLRFFDPTSGAWRTDWDFEQPNLTIRNGLTSALRGDATLPAGVEVNITMNGPDGAPITLTSVVPVMATSPAFSLPPPAKSNSNQNGTSSPPISAAPAPSGSTGTTLSPAPGAAQ